MDPGVKKVIIFMKYALVIVCFAVLCIELIINSRFIFDSIAILGFAIVFPIFLLIRVLQYKCKYSFLFVFAFFTAYLINIVHSLFYNLGEMNRAKDVSSDDIFGTIGSSVCHECLYIDGLRLLPCVFISVMLMFSETIAGKIDFSAKDLRFTALLSLPMSFLLAILG